MILSKTKLLLVISLLCGFAIVALGCKDKTKEEKSTSSVAALTIAMIEENYKTVDTKDAVLKASIVEFKDVTNYTYLDLKDSTGRIWAAIPKTSVETGSEIELANIIVMKDFHSKILDKTFATILFAVPFSKDSNARSSLPNAETPAYNESGMPPGMMPGAMPQGGAMPGPGTGAGKSGAMLQDIRVIKATGDHAYTIEEIYAGKKALAKSTVKVRAKVVKFLPNIMGKNWIHIQDGTGSAEKMNNDLTATTIETVDVGDEIIVQGTLSVDNDLGSGYVFAALIEDASVEKLKN
ncbi:MAG TPA: OB-fold nucleic acid binding domain-containing protein [Anaerolineae bacterium]|nr:OB-fold nucleic acid binding domain-containing protein [Anaerolineae bacterium]